MSSVTQAAATFDDLRRVEGKAESIAGRIVQLMPTGHKPNRVAARIYRSLDDHAKATGLGVAHTDNCYRAATPDQPAVFGTGQTADAEPVIPGWRLPVDRVFA
jgi:hypothetical protein